MAISVRGEHENAWGGLCGLSSSCGQHLPVEVEGSSSPQYPEPVPEMHRGADNVYGGEVCCALQAALDHSDPRGSVPAKTSWPPHKPSRRNMCYAYDTYTIGVIATIICQRT